MSKSSRLANSIGPATGERALDYRIMRRYFRERYEGRELRKMTSHYYTSRTIHTIRAKAGWPANRSAYDN